MPRPSAAARLAEGYVAEPGGCWIWQRRLNSGGYGAFYLDGTRMGAHRAAHLIHKGPIPEGFDVDHLCRRRACVNPDHLEAVTRSENLRRGRVGQWNRATEKCPQGHAYDKSNTYHDPRGWRGCRTCRADSARRYHQRRAA